MWEAYKKGYKSYLQLEKSLSDNSVDAYMLDVEKFTQFLLHANSMKTPAEIELQDLQHFIKWITELGISVKSQARIISGMRSFYKYCVIENIVKKDPTVLLEAAEAAKKIT